MVNILGSVQNVMVICRLLNLVLNQTIDHLIDWKTDDGYQGKGTRVEFCLD